MRYCRICGADKFKLVLDMGKQPLVNSLIEKEDLDNKEEVFPLKVEQCQECKLVQIVEPVKSHDIYAAQDYLYFSGDMPGLKDYFQEYADDIKNRFSELGDFIVEIGSNDGLMLDMFQPLNRVLGVDPATNVVVRALANRISTLSAGFSERLARNIRQEFEPAKVIFGNNCIAHIDNLHDVLRGVEALLTKNGVFIIECNYWGGMVKNRNYSLIYHDHYSYFTIKDWFHASIRHGLKPFDAIVTPAQGGSLRIFLDRGQRDRTDRLTKLILEEEETNLSSYETCQRYNKECNFEAKALGVEIQAIDMEGKVIAGYGAAAKGFSILSLAGITDEIDFFIDDSPAKQGKYTPVNHIPVYARANIPEEPDVYVITAPNYADIIKEKEKDFRGEWIIP